MGDVLVGYDVYEYTSKAGNRLKGCRLYFELSSGITAGKAYTVEVCYDVNNLDLDRLVIGERYHVLRNRRGFFDGLIPA